MGWYQMHGKTDVVVFGILAFCILSGLVQAATVECDSCTDCSDKIAAASAGDTILLNTSFSTTASCIGIPVGFSNITFDCQGNTVWGSNDACLTGIASYFSFYITVQNCNFYGFDGAGIGLDTCAYWSVINSSFRWGNFTGYCGATGINLLFTQFSNFTNVDLSDNAFGFNENYASDGNRFNGITANRNIYGNGFALGADTKYNVVNGLEANYNSVAGLLLSGGANYNEISNVNMTGNTYYGIDIEDSSYNNITAFVSSQSGVSGIYFGDSGGSSVGNLIFNGIFNNTVNFVNVDLDNAGYWNTTPSYANNIINGYKIGGNFWSGYSESCADSDVDSICDVPLVLDASNTDELPLRYYPINLSQYSLTISYPPYASVGDTVTIHAYLSLNGVSYNVTQVLIDIDGSTALMTWDGASESFIVYWVPVSNGDYPFNLTAFVMPDQMQADGLIKVRTPFNITVRIWNTVNMTPGSDYRNEFSWIYLTRDVDPTLHVLLGRNKFACPPEGPDECFWHAAYRNGTATVTLYEPGNYTMYIVGNNIEWQMYDPLGDVVPCTFCAPWIVQQRLLMNLGGYYLNGDEDMDLYQNPTDLLVSGFSFGVFASQLSILAFGILAIVFFFIVLVLTGSLKAAIAGMVLLPTIIYLALNVLVW